MKKLLVLLFSIFFLSSPSVFAETYVCSQDLERFGRKGEIETIKVERDGNKFTDLYGGYQISQESNSLLILTDATLMENLYVIFINKDTKEWGQIALSMNEFRTESPSPLSYGKCNIVN